MKRLLIAMVFAAALVSSAADALLTAGRNSAPVIDGELNDQCWRDSIAAMPFQRENNAGFAVDATQVRVSYDDKNLYLAFRCAAACLNPVENRLHEFRTLAGAMDDAKIFADDCILVLLQPRPEGPVYDFVVNGAGVVNDARCSSRNLWESRDVSWNSGIRAATQRQNGFWTVELAIPFSVLGAVPLQKNGWKILAGRINPGVQEKSAWPELLIGFHNTANFGELRFVPKVTGFEITSMPAFQPGANTLTLIGADKLMFQAQIQYPGGTPQRLTGRNGLLVFSLEQAGDFSWQWSALNPASLAVSYRSPAYRLSTNALALQFDPANQITVNGVNARPGIFLKSGPNSIEIKGKLIGKLLGGGHQIVPPAAKFTLLAADSRCWPDWSKEGISVNCGGYQQLMFAPRGADGFELDDYTLYLDLPEGYTFEGASGFYKLWPLQSRTVGAVEIDGKPYARYAVRIMKPVSFVSEPALHYYITVLVKAPEAANASSGAIYFHAGSEQKNIVEIPQKIAVRLLPSLPLPSRPKSLQVQLWFYFLHVLDDKELSRKIARHSIQIGATEIPLPEYDGKDIRRFFRIEIGRNLTFGDFLKDFPDTALIDQKGTASHTLICPGVMLTRPEFAPYRKAGVAKWLAYYHFPENVKLDFEYNVFSGPLSCYCSRCREEFGRGNPQEHVVEWTAFMNRRLADLCKILRQEFRLQHPSAIFSGYSGYQSADTRLRYGVDWKLLDGVFDLGSCGYGRPFQALEDTKKALRKTSLMLGELLFPYEVSQRYAPGCMTAATLLRRAADCNGGILLFAYEAMDGRSFAAICEVSAVMAEFEPFFRQNSKQPQVVKLPGWPREDYEVLTNDAGAQLLLLMNQGNSPRSYQLPAASGVVPSHGVKAIRLP